MYVRIKISKVKTIQILCIYLSMQYYGGRLYTLLGSAIFFSLSLAMSFGVFAYRKNLLFNVYRKVNSYIFSIIVMSIWFLFSIFYTDRNMTVGTSLSILSRFLLIYVSVGIDPKNFLIRFVNMVALFAVVSDMIYLSHFIGFHSLWVVVAKVMYRIPSGMYYGGDTYGLFFLVFKTDDLARNSYMFGEPGEYQMIINTCLYFMLFYGKDIDLDSKKKNIIIVILLFTLLTIQSTSGFVSLIMITGCSVLQLKIEENNKATRKIIMIAILTALIYILFFATEESIFYKSFYNKIFSDTGQVNLHQGTANARSMPYYLMMENLFTNPLQVIFGVGPNGLVHTVVGRYTANGLVNFIMMCGLIFVIPMYTFLSISNFLYAKNMTASITALLICFNQSLGQPDMLSIYSVLLLVYPYIRNTTQCKKKDLIT